MKVVPHTRALRIIHQERIGSKGGPDIEMVLTDNKKNGNEKKKKTNSVATLGGPRKKTSHQKSTSGDELEENDRIARKGRL